MKQSPNVLSVDIGGTGVKILASGHSERRRFPSGRQLTPEAMVAQVKALAADWPYDVVAIGYPGRIVDERILSEPRNLGPGWVGFDFAAAFGCPVKLINDAAMQALGSYQGGTMLFLGLGTGLGSTLIVRGHIVPMELGALAYGKGSIEDHLGLRGLEKLGKKKWRQTLGLLVDRFTTALMLDDVVIGGGNAKKLKTLPKGCRLGDNAFAFEGGYRLWAPVIAAQTGSGQAQPCRCKPGEARPQVGPSPATAFSAISRFFANQETRMQLGMIGLGRMGANMVRRLIGGGHECVVFDRSPQAVAEPGQGPGRRRRVAGRLRGQARQAARGVADGAGRGGRRRHRRSAAAAGPRRHRHRRRQLVLRRRHPPRQGPGAQKASTTSTSAPAAACGAWSAATA